MPNKVGRPKLDKHKARTKVITLRLTEPEYLLINSFVPTDYGNNQSEWIRKTLLYVITNGIRIT